MSILTVSNLAKSYRSYSSELKRVASWFGLPVKPAEEHWVLHDISFSISPGESVGLVGQNGAGKSTLLKMITGTLPPTKGTIQANGRIAAILELGMGFNPEFTGRQNALHGLSMMGYSQAQIDQVMPELEAFAEIGEYFDQPVRTYSSGMQMRVAFGVATAFRPEILIVDEALSVGDTYFQHKSFDRIKQFQEQGTSLLLVSHDRSAIQAVCDRAILLENGYVIKDDEPEAVMDFYNALIAEKENSTVTQTKTEDGKVKTSSGTGQAKTKQVGLYNSKNQLAEIIAVGETVQLRVLVEVFDDLESLVLGYGIKDRLGQVVFGTNTWHTKQILHNVKTGEQHMFTIEFPACFGVGSYSIQTALTDKDTHLTANYEWVDRAIVFNIANIDKNHFAGLLWQEPHIDIKRA